MAEERPRTKLILKVNESERTITLPYPNSNDRSYEKIHMDLERIQFFSIGHGGVQGNEEITLKFEQEEFNCSLRYLLKFDWSRQP
jgi:hypothetical protein